MRQQYRACDLQRVGSVLPCQPLQLFDLVPGERQMLALNCGLSLECAAGLAYLVTVLADVPGQPPNNGQSVTAGNSRLSGNIGQGANIRCVHGVGSIGVNWYCWRRSAPVAQ